MVVLGRRGRNSLAFNNNFSPTRSVWFHDLLPFFCSLVFFTFRIRLELVVSAPFDCEQEHGSTFELSIKSTILLSLVLNSFMSRTSTSAIISVCLFRAIVRESIFSDRLTSRDLGTHTVSLESSFSSATFTKLFVTSSTVVPSAPSSSSSTSIESLANFNSESTPILCFLEQARTCLRFSSFAKDRFSKSSKRAPFAVYICAVIHGLFFDLVVTCSSGMYGRVVLRKRSVQTRQATSTLSVPWIASKRGAWES